MWRSRRLTTLWATTACYIDSLARKADKLTAVCEQTVWKMWESRRLTTLCASTACYRDSFNFTSYFSSVAPIYLPCSGCERSNLFRRTPIWAWSLYSDNVAWNVYLCETREAMSRFVFPEASAFRCTSADHLTLLCFLATTISHSCLIQEVTKILPSRIY
jgi:hypothetical protein